MKQNRIALLISVIATLLSLAGYFCSVFFVFNWNYILQDISISIFSSSFFIIALSLLGYFIEKKRSKNTLLANGFLAGLDGLMSIFDDKNSCNRQGLNTLIINLLHQTKNIKDQMVEYNNGLFFKDETLKKIVNNNLFNFHKSLSEFQLYIASPQQKSEVVKIQIENIIEAYSNLADEIFNWMAKNNFGLGKAFAYDENFIADYEKQVLKIKEDEL